jgi:hypothetical protein
VRFDQESQGGFEGKAGGDERLDRESMEALRVILELGEEVVEGFELPAALEILAVKAFTEFFDPRRRLFVLSIVSHLVSSSMI